MNAPPASCLEDADFCPPPRWPAVQEADRVTEGVPINKTLSHISHTQAMVSWYETASSVDGLVPGKPNPNWKTYTQTHKHTHS